MPAAILIKQYTAQCLPSYWSSNIPHNACRYIDQAIYRTMPAAILIKQHTAQCLPP
jgi:hypothetical protein